MNKPSPRLRLVAMAASTHAAKLTGLGMILVAMGGLTSAARAESALRIGAVPSLSASARLDFRITIPRMLFLRVGTGSAFAANTTVDTVEFNVPEGASGSGVAVAGQSPTAITARVVGNGDNISFSAAGSAGGLAGPGTSTVPWTQIVAAAGSVSGSGTLPHPAIGSGTAGAATTLVAAGGIVDQSATWSFNYKNETPMAAGTYSGQVIYTATLP